MVVEQIKVGVIGLGQRGKSLTHTILACNEADIIAVCDCIEERRKTVSAIIKESRGHEALQYKDYHDLLQDKDVEVVVICSSWDEHIRMAIESMKAGKITAMEVGGAYDVEECWELVRTYEETRTPIMMLENCCFDKFELLSTSIARTGLLGEVVYLHGAYSHDLRCELLYNNYNYRLGNYVNRNCENYPTHELGPIAKLIDINRGNRMVSLVSVASKAVGLEEYANTEKDGEKPFAGFRAKQGDIVTTIIKCANGESVTLTLDTTLPKHYSREFTVRGTKGYCMQETNMVLIEGKDSLHDYLEPHLTTKKYLSNGDSYQAYLPDVWRNITEEEMKLGHGGMDFMMFKAFFKAVLNGAEMPVDVYDAAAWMCVSALSEQSIALGGAPIVFPDFTRGKWLTRKRLDVVDFPRVNQEN